MPSKRKLLVFGVGPSADVAAELFRRSEQYEFVGFVLDRQFLNATHHGGFPIFAYEDIRNSFGPESYEIFVSVGYRRLNRLRAEVCARVQNDGYVLPTLIQDRGAMPESLKVGSNCLIMAGASIHPAVSIGDNVFIWAGATVCHHTRLGSHGWITAGATISGNCTVGDSFFIGANATLVNDLSVGSECFVGAGALVSRNLDDKSVVVRAGDDLFGLSSDQFLELVKLKGF